MPANFPNVIVITADQMRADAMGCSPNAAVITPHLDRLAASGIIFDNAYCVNPVCTPSRAAILTGRYPHNIGAWNIGVSLNEDERTIPDHLRPLGFKSVALGKMHFRPQTRPFDVADHPVNDSPAVRFRPRSDNTYYGFDAQHITEDDMNGEYLDWLARSGPEFLNNPTGDPGDQSLHEKGSLLPPRLHQTHWIGQQSVNAILRHDPARPLFMWTSFVDPHHPFNAPRSYVEKYARTNIPVPIQKAGEHDRRPEHLRSQGTRGYWPGGGEEHKHTDLEIRHIIRNYYAMITLIDDQIGRILSALDQKGMRQDTLIIFTADHGELLGDHGLLLKGPWLYEGLVRVPMIMSGPNVPPGRRTAALMENLDILPTILDFLGQPIPYGIQGQSQFPIARGVANRVRDSVICSYDAHDRGIRLKMLRTSSHKLNVFARESYGELFDLRQDPLELQNRFSDPAHAHVRNELMELFLHRLIEDEDPLPERKCWW